MAKLARVAQRAEQALAARPALQRPELLAAAAAAAVQVELAVALVPAEEAEQVAEEAEQVAQLAQLVAVAAAELPGVVRRGASVALTVVPRPTRELTSAPRGARCTRAQVRAPPRIQWI